MTIAAIRFNNPGNVSLPIQGWHGGGSIVGISGQSGYASFPSMQIGYAAFQQRLANYIDVKGYTTIGQLNSVYAEDTKWGNGVSAISGIGVNTPLNTSDPKQMADLQRGIIQHETGKTLSQLGIDPNGSFSPDIPQGSNVGYSPFTSDLVAPAANYTPLSAGGFGETPFVQAPDAAGTGFDMPSSLGGVALPVSGTGAGAAYTLDPGIASAAGADPTALAGAPDAAQAGTIYTPTDTSYGAITQDQQAAGKTFASATSSQNPHSKTIPEAIDAQTKGASADTTAANKAIQGAAQVIQNSAKLVAQTAKDTTDKTDSSMKNIFTRGTMVVTGLVFLAAGLWLFAHPEEFSGLKSSLAPA